MVSHCLGLFSCVRCQSGLSDSILTVGGHSTLSLHWSWCVVTHTTLVLFFIFCYNCTQFGITSLMSSFSTEFSAFFDDFSRFLKFLKLGSEKVFCKYLMFGWIWHHDSLMIKDHMIFLHILSIFLDFLFEEISFSGSNFLKRRMIT